MSSAEACKLTAEEAASADRLGTRDSAIMDAADNCVAGGTSSVIASATSEVKEGATACELATPVVAARDSALVSDLTVLVLTAGVAVIVLLASPRVPLNSTTFSQMLPTCLST